MGAMGEFYLDVISLCGFYSHRRRKENFLVSSKFFLLMAFVGRSFFIR
jgi:hypothetical protein